MSLLIVLALSSTSKIKRKTGNFIIFLILIFLNFFSSEILFIIIFFILAQS